MMSTYVTSISEEDITALDFLAMELHMSRSQSISVFTDGNAASHDECGGCGAPLVETYMDAQGRVVRDFECGHRYRVGHRVVTIERRL